MALTSTPSTHKNFRHITCKGNIYCDGNLAVDGTTELDGDVTLNGALAVTGAVTLTAALQAVTVQALPLCDFRKYDAWKDALADAAAAGSLGLADTPGSVLKATASNGAAVDDAAVFLFTLPPSYKDGAAITVRVRAKKDTTAGTVSDQVDVVAKLVGDTLGSDICATAVQSITTSYVNYDFTITPTGLVAGDILAIEVHGMSDDTGGTTNKEVFISRVEVRTAIA